MFCGCKSRIVRIEQKLAELNQKDRPIQLWEAREEVIRSLLSDRYSLEFFQNIVEGLNKLQMKP